MRINKSPRRIKRDAGGRSKKNPTQQLLAKNSRIQLDKLEVKPSRKTYVRFTRKKQLSYLPINCNNYRNIILSKNANMEKRKT